MDKEDACAAYRWLALSHRLHNFEAHLRVLALGNSNTVSIRVSDLPEDAFITKLTVNTGTMSYSGAVVCNSLTISSSNGRTEQIGWTGQANKTLTTSRFLASAANGTYTISFNATNMSSLDLGTKSYQPSITIYWDDEF